MFTLWKDAPEPIQYRGSRCSCGFLIKLISPIVLILMTCWFVIMTYYIAPDSIQSKDKPTLEIPSYYFIKGTLVKDNETYSYLGCNFPAFQRHSIVPLRSAPIYRSMIDPYGRVNISLIVPSESNFKMIDAQLIIPLSFRFNYYGKPKIYSYISISFPCETSYNTYTYSGSLMMRQTGDLIQINDTLAHFLDSIDPVNYNDVFTIDHIYETFSVSPIDTSFVGTDIKSSANANLTDKTSFTIKFNVPTVTINMPSPYWNILRNTYIQLFYWAWVIVAIFHPFIKHAYQYSIIPSSIVRLLEPYKKEKMD